MTAIPSGPAPQWIAAAVHAAGWPRKHSEREIDQLAAELLERLPMDAVRREIYLRIKDPRVDSSLALAIAERASVAVVEVLGDPNLDAPTDRETYLEVSAALDRCGAPRVLDGRSLTLAERVVELAVARHQDRNEKDEACIRR